MPTLKPEIIYFEDNGIIPNNKYPLLLYQHVFTAEGITSATWLEQKFNSNNWTNSWRWGIYPFHHYHSNTHEVLGVYSGKALLLLGGPQGQEINVQFGDIIVIPAGVGHKNLSSSPDFSVVGAYPGGISPDLKKGEPGDRPQADINLAAVPIPDFDPLMANQGGLKNIWK